MHSKKVLCLVLLIFFEACGQSTGKSHHHNKHHKEKEKEKEKEHHHEDHDGKEHHYKDEEYRPRPYYDPDFIFDDFEGIPNIWSRWRHNNDYYNRFSHDNEFRKRDDSKCGVSYRVNQLIVNGAEFDNGAFPWLVALYAMRSNTFTFICGGTLVSLKHVVTAAHCVQIATGTINPSDIYVVAGKCDLSNITKSDNSVFKVKEVRAHPDYKSLSADGDVAVLELDDELERSENIKPACLWSGDSDLNDVEGIVGVVAGWGKMENGELSLSKPKFVKMPIVSQEICLRSHYVFSEITSERTFCAGNGNGSGPCNGDSGGGFMIQRNGRWFLRGLVSLSLSSGVATVGCDLSLFVVFADVSKYNDWLESVVK